MTLTTRLALTTNNHAENRDCASSWSPCMFGLLGLLELLGLLDLIGLLELLGLFRSISDNLIT